MFQTWIMTDPILYLSMLMGLGGVYVFISSFHDDDDGDDDGEKYIFNFKHTNLAKWLIFLKIINIWESCLLKQGAFKNILLN